MSVQLARSNTPARALRIAKSWESCRFSACFARGGVARSNRTLKQVGHTDSTDSTDFPHCFARGLNSSGKR